MEIVGAAAGEVTGSTIVHVEREFGYLIHFRRSASNLKDNIQKLTDIKRDVQAMIDAALRNGELVKEAVQGWMARADRVLVEASKVSEEASVINSWFRGWCCGRFSLGRKAQKTIQVIQGLYAEGSGFGADNVSYPKPTQSLNLVDAEDFNAFTSRDSTAEEIHKALLEDATNLVGVYGMPGVGKTTLIRAIAKQVKEEQLFQEVVVVTVSQNPSLIKLQGDIAEGLDLSLTGDNLSRRAQKLSERLSQNDKATLVILDDIWERIELSEVGIPYKNKGSCCKVVFTTRDQGVCDKMEVSSQIEVALLSQDDSWILFRQKAGTTANLSVALDILSECKFLPLAIVTLGLALRNKNESVCLDALQQLRKSIFKGMSPVVSSIKLSYNFLESESLKICFLFCALFPEDHKINLDKLLSYVMGEKLLEDVNTYDEAKGRLFSIVYELASSGLLLRDKDGEMTMHDVVRDVAISIAVKEEGHIVKAGRDLSSWPDMDLGNCKRLSMMHNPIKSFPTFPIKAPHLQALFLNDNRRLFELPSDFFAGMESLMTLDLSDTNINSLPPSLSCLQNLRTLLLNQNRLGLSNLSPIEKLKRLEVLSIRNSVVTGEFPQGIGNLINLRILDLTGSKIKSISINLFSKLSRLEELHVLGSLFSGVPEFGSLSQLTSLELQIYDSDLCHVYIRGTSLKYLKRFKVVVGSVFEDISKQDEGEDISIGKEKSNWEQNEGSMRSLWLKDFSGKQVANWVLMLLGRTNYLELSCCRDIHNVTELGAKGMNDHLKYLKLSKCHQMESLITNVGVLESNENAFSNLEKLHIQEMGSLVEICKGTPPTRLFSKLKTLSFISCSRLAIAISPKFIQNLGNLEFLKFELCSNLLNVGETEEEEGGSQVSNMSRISEPLVLPIFPNLKCLFIKLTKIRYVFTMTVARCLSLLQQLEIDACREMEVIFKYAVGEDIKCNDNAVLPRLWRLTVMAAPKLKSFTNQNLVMEFSSLKYLSVYFCGSLERLPFGTKSVPNLNTFDMEEKVFNRLEWEDARVKASLQFISKR